MSLFWISILLSFSVSMTEAQTFRERIKSKIKERITDKLNSEPAPKVHIIDKSNLKAGLYTQSLEIKGLNRFYNIYLPKSFNPNKLYPLVFSLHGGSGDMNIQSNDEYYHLLSSADKNDYIAIMPNGYSQFPSGKIATWNAGNCCGQARDLNIDDVAFVKAIIEKTKTQFGVDSKRIFSSGMSNGAMMSYRLACEMSDLFSGIASVAGTDNTQNCKPAKPISIFHTHAKDDDHVKFDGGIGEGAVSKEHITDFKSVAHTIQKWVQFNQCQTTPKKIAEEKGYYCEKYEGCKNGTIVQLCVTDSGGHSWPGGSSPGKLRNKKPFQGFSATEKNWEFFSNINPKLK